MLVAQGIHGLPEATMFKRHELALLGQRHQGFAFPARRIIFDQRQTAGGKHEEPAIDQSAITPGFFQESR